jgi:hypothetical protein
MLAVADRSARNSLSGSILGLFMVALPKKLISLPLRILKNVYVSILLVKSLPVMTSLQLLPSR